MSKAATRLAVWRKIGIVAAAMRRRAVRAGRCPVCRAGRAMPLTLFMITGHSYRESTICVRCRSNARNRALMAVLDDVRPLWREASVLEIGAGGAVTDALASSCSNHIKSQYLPGVDRGAVLDGFRSEDVEALTLETGSVDILVSEDVLEHVFDLEAALREIHRVLRPGGVHVFTIPCRLDMAISHTRAVRGANGVVTHLLEPQFHGDPLNPEGVLVVSDFGADFPELVEARSGMQTKLTLVRGPGIGVFEACPVFVSTKRADLS